MMASSNKKWPKVMSSYHQNRHCGPCQKEQPQHTCILPFLQTISGCNVPNDSCLCRAHSKEAKQHRSDPEFIPKKVYIK